MEILEALLSGLRNFFNPVISVILFFFNPVVSFFTAAGLIISWLLGALANPQGMMNGVVNSVIDVVSSILPSTPSSLKIGTIINNVSSFMPGIGRAVISEVFFTLSSIFVLYGAVKLYKLIPFKAT